MNGQRLSLLVLILLIVAPLVVAAGSAPKEKGFYISFISDTYSECLVYDGAVDAGEISESFDYSEEMLLSALKSCRQPRVYLDYDLYCELSDGAREYLSSIGFVPSEKKLYIPEQAGSVISFILAIDSDVDSAEDWAPSFRDNYPDAVWRIPRVLFEALTPAGRRMVGLLGLDRSLIELI